MRQNPDSGDEARRASTADTAAHARLAGQIKRIRRQLTSPDTVRHPRVATELQELYRQVIGALDERRGRHRRATGLETPDAGHDAWHDAGQQAATREPALEATVPGRQPDPLAARTAAEFVTALRHYREWSGDVPLRDVASGAHWTVADNTMFAALKDTKLARLKSVIAIVAGCGGPPEDQQAFATAWRQIRSTKNAPPEPG